MLNFLSNFFLFLPFWRQKCWKSIFWPGFAVFSPRSLVKIYNKSVKSIKNRLSSTCALSSNLLYFDYFFEFALLRLLLWICSTLTTSWNLLYFWLGSFTWVKGLLLGLRVFYLGFMLMIYYMFKSAIDQEKYSPISHFIRVKLGIILVRTIATDNILFK